MEEVNTTYRFQNNQGSAVSITYEVGVSISCGSVRWDDTQPATLNTGNASYVMWALGCTKGKGVRSTLRIKENNGSWGPTAYSKSITCK